MIAMLGAAACGRIAFDPVVDGNVPPFTVTCSAFVPALADPPPAGFGEVALHPDGLRLVGYDNLAMMLEVARSTTSATSAFGSPGPVSVTTAPMRDISFATIEGELIAVGHSGASPRGLLLCRDLMFSFVCDDLAVIDEATSTLIIDDHDGPNVAIRDRVPLLTFNRGDRTYVARPSAPDLLTWRAREVDTRAQVDDPAVTPDGEVLFLADRMAGIVAMRWDASLETFVDRVVVGEGASPAIGLQRGGSFELFVSAQPRGVVEPVVTTCTPTP